MEVQMQMQLSWCRAYQTDRSLAATAPDWLDLFAGGVVMYISDVNALSSDRVVDLFPFPSLSPYAVLVS